MNITKRTYIKPKSTVITFGFTNTFFQSGNISQGNVEMGNFEDGGIFSREEEGNNGLWDNVE